jgi:hypothetical protein
MIKITLTDNKDIIDVQMVDGELSDFKDNKEIHELAEHVAYDTLGYKRHEVGTIYVEEV